MSILRGGESLRRWLLAIFLLLPVPSALFTVAPAQAACHVVTPSGSGAKTGTDWNNAYAGLPSTLTRGDTYYLADGTYNAYYDFNEPLSGTSVITVKKAISSNHCTDTGWNLATMGSGQASFGVPGGAGCRNVGIAQSANTGYITIDGQVGNGFTKGSYGILWQLSYNASQCANGPYNIYIGGNYGTYSATNITIQYVEVAGSCGGLTEDSTYRSSCNAISDTPKSDENFYVWNCRTCTFKHIFVHNSSGTPFAIITKNSGVTVENSFVRLNNHTLSQHANIADFHTGNTGITFANNQFNDTEGSGGLTSLNAGSAGTDSNLSVYGNVFWWTSGNPTTRYGYGDGAIACLNGNNCTNWFIYNNTIANYPGPSYNAGIQWLNGSSGASTAVAENNLWYNICGPSVQVTVGTGTNDYNTFLNVCNNNPGGGSHNYYTASGSSNPFVSSSDFHLSSESVDPHLNDGVSLSSPYNVDPDGNTRGADGTWERGAFEYDPGTAGTQSSTPDPPSNLSVTVN